MEKKAYLAEFSIRTRIVVDVPSNMTRQQEDQWLDDNWGKLAELAAANIKDDPDGYLHGDNLVYVDADTECPYGSID